MLARENGTPQRCVRNLLSIVQGENPFERCKGISVDLTDQPASLAAGEVAAEVGQVLEEYEPRCDEDDIELTVDDVLTGMFFLNANITTEE